MSAMQLSASKRTGRITSGSRDELALEASSVSSVNTRLRVLKDMILFVEVARRKNYSEAARALEMPLSTLARRIARLERELGVMLIERTTRHQRLTAEGREYFERCRHIVDDAMGTFDALYTKVHGLSGTIKLSMCDLSGAFMLKSIEEFVDSHAQLSFEVAGQGGIEGWDEDISVIVGDPKRDSVTARKLGTMPVGLFASPDYLAQHGAIETRAQLSEHRLIVPTSFREYTDAYLHEILTTQSRGHARLNFSKFSSLLVPLIASGAGLAAIPIIVAEPFVSSGHLLPVLPGWKPILLPVFAIIRDRRLPARTREFLTHLSKYVSKSLGSSSLTLIDFPKSKAI